MKLQTLKHLQSSAGCRAGRARANTASAHLKNIHQKTQTKFSNRTTLLCCLQLLWNAIGTGRSSTNASSGRAPNRPNTHAMSNRCPAANNKRNTLAAPYHGFLHQSDPPSKPTTPITKLNTRPLPTPDHSQLRSLPTANTQRATMYAGTCTGSSLHWVKPDESALQAAQCETEHA